MDRVQLPQSWRATLSRQFTFYHQVPRIFWYSFDWSWKDCSNILLQGTNSLLLLLINFCYTTRIMIKNLVKYYCKKLKENYSRILKIEKRTERQLLVTFWNVFFSVNSKEISAERLENISLESII